MKKILMIIFIVALLSAITIYYNEYIKERTLLVNDEEYLYTNPNKNKIKELAIEEQTEILLKSSREKVLLNISNTDIDIIEFEEIKINEDDNTITINIFHNLPVEEKLEEIPFEVEENKITTLYIGEKEIIQEGQNGSVTSHYIKVFENGVVIDATEINFTTVEPINQIVEIGTKEKVVSNTRGKSSSKYTSNTNNVNKNKPKPKPSSKPAYKYKPGAYKTYDLCWAAGLKKVEQNGGSGRFMCSRLPDGTSNLSWWDR